MTTQMNEKLRYQGKDMTMCSTPLGTYFAMGGIEPCFKLYSTALWRGYLGSWEIVDDRLYLIRLTGNLGDWLNYASLATIFPEFPDRVFAHWYSGTICIPQGGNDSNLLIVFYVQIMPDDFVMQLHRF
ncbi:hypothetical protein [Leclercia adecarboxylata]|uniref:hypothetical protein n=1 Tax=Leclercia adecarboxylata TaxID=83655 RepID=UPI002949BA50|nr:hypothetical protein [Leclercia adecarboxylata]MDV5240993.1 hypothetical protein [Leclercia adecarboxylata]MDV5277557.1 hypothetical protein [Leclercia adecarboxylata]MDV5459857.1 hypothetical protein [Leclercia adecarboxylata]MDV5504993.1 hypothetical protein [Leclercia adecarboxylata]MDV5564468.1 hypothetical protein [Leclercia adecarboxylata]